MPSPFVFFAATAAVLLVLLISVLYARAIQCAWCCEPFAVYPRVCGELCRDCASSFDRRRAMIGRRRRVLRWIRRAA